MRFIDWFWRDRDTGQIIVAQWPNLWLWIFAAVSAVGLITTNGGPAGIGLHSVATVFLVIWAGDELLRGVGPWRRCLGAAVLIGFSIKLLV